MFLITENAFAKCKKEDFKNFVSTKKVCIGIEPVGKKVDGKFLITERKKLLVYLHGYRGPDQNDRKLINSIKNKDSNAILMAMPGYLTPGWKNKYSGSKKKQYSKSGTEPIAQAVVKLKNYYISYI